jgi:hypothetical protein
MKRDVLREHQFQLNWEKVEDVGCTQVEIEEIEKLICHIIVEHRPMLCEKYQLSSPLGNMEISGEFIEEQHGNLETDPFEMVALAELALMLQGSCTYINTFGMIHLIGYGLMRIDCFRAVSDGTELLIDWRAKDSSPLTTDIRCLMSVKFGQKSDGIASASDLLESLRQWDALADVVGDCATADEILTKTLERHFSSFGRLLYCASMTMKIWPKTFFEIRFAVQPMWSPFSDFRSRSELASFLTLPKPGPMPKPVDSVPGYFGCLPRGNNDYLVDYDKRDSKWALLFSPRLGIYYKVTVQLSGTTIDDRTDFFAAMLVRKEPTKYIEEEIAKLEGRDKVRSKSKSLNPFMDDEDDDDEPKSATGDVTDHAPDNETDNNY